MRTAKGKGADALKQAVVPLATCLLVLAILPHRRFGWTDVKVMALAVALATIAVFLVPYLWEHLVGRKNSNSN
jgi:protein-S-isoprenylcysteine O-methyltransferase Ste14